MRIIQAFIYRTESEVKFFKEWRTLHQKRYKTIEEYKERVRPKTVWRMSKAEYIEWLKQQEKASGNGKARGRGRKSKSKK